MQNWGENARIGNRVLRLKGDYMGYEELKIEGRNAVLEAFRSGKTIDKLFVLDGCQDGPVRTIVREAKKYDTIIHFVEKEPLGGANNFISYPVKTFTMSWLFFISSRFACSLSFLWSL